MRHKRTIIYFTSFILALPVALTSYINSSFLESFWGAQEVSLIYVISSFFAIFFMVKLPRILTHLGNKRASNIFSVLTFISFMMLALGESAIMVASGFVINFVALTLLYISLDIFIEDFSRGKAIGTLRGFYLGLINMAWILAQLVSSKIIVVISFSGIYLVSALLMVLVYLIMKLTLRNFTDPKYEDTPFLKGLKFFTKNKNIGRIYLLNLILKLFYAWMVIYMPIYLHEYLGFEWSQIGIIFTIMLLPFLLEFPLGKISDKIGEKKILKLGFLISAAATLTIPLVTENTVFVWAGILFATRLGAAMIEIMSENYFFKSVNEENVEALGFFRNTSPVSYIIGPVIALGVLQFVPSFVYLFYILGAVLLTGFLLTFRLREVR